MTLPFHLANVTVTHQDVDSQVFRLNFQTKHFDIYFPPIDENNIYTANVILSCHTSMISQAPTMAATLQSLLFDSWTLS